jgi:Holliday junction resolvase RusA-like endonuclease
MKIYIPYEFDNWNQYINQERTNKFIGAKIKAEEKRIVGWYVKGMTYKGKYPVKLVITKYFKDKRQDLDNVRIKGVLDGLVASKVIKNDNLTCITEITLKAEFNKEKEGLEIEVLENEVNTTK